ncbi:MAG: 2-hydroxyacyl-CoA dehydratase family protein, partial [Dehalococcoidia bacterium]
GLGATVVIDDHCTGTKYIWEDVAEGGEPIPDITRRYIAKPACPQRDVASPGRRHPTHVLRLAQEWGVQGVIFIQEKFCDPHLWDFPVIEKVLKENGLPTLWLEVDVTTPVGQFRTRLEAFLETLELEVA